MQLFSLRDPLARSAFRGTVRPDPGWKLLRGEMKLTRPVCVEYALGNKMLDFLWAELYPLVSDRVIDLLTSQGLSGWSTYPVDVRDRNGRSIKGYRGLCILGRCQQICLDKEHSRVVYEENARGRFPYYRGLYVSTDSWDRSDFFMSTDERTAYKVVTGRVSSLFRTARVKNVQLEPLSDVQVYASDQPKFLSPPTVRSR